MKTVYYLIIVWALHVIFIENARRLIPCINFNIFIRVISMLSKTEGDFLNCMSHIHVF